MGTPPAVQGVLHGAGRAHEGEPSTTSGRLSVGSSARWRPSALACSTPLSDKGCVRVAVVEPRAGRARSLRPRGRAGQGTRPPPSPGCRPTSVPRSCWVLPTCARPARWSTPWTAGGAPRPVLDERLRERDLGLFDGMTGQGIKDTYPEEAARRSAMGKFYYRPPGGESWTDVVLRVRSGSPTSDRAGGPAGVGVHPPGGDHGVPLPARVAHRAGAAPASTAARRSATARSPSTGRHPGAGSTWWSTGRRPPRGVGGRTDPRGAARAGRAPTAGDRS